MKNALLRHVIIVALCLGALSSVRAADPATLETVEWTVTELEGKPVAASDQNRGKAPTLRLDAGKKQATGFSGVNRFFGGYVRDGEKLKFGALAGTRMAGPPDAMALEGKYLGALGKVTQFRISDQTLELLQDGQIVARFDAANAAKK